ncbi:hypothetical protein CVT25_006770 [Psilocybe cyanescens]|uniref:Uncharacterized protein n=1 Tax=Psilocybe cyanescens TaxID=93625 RepID=A0A409X7I5_PSICY|nr:hypothetical protein CVT25_006770 [Psilocybe cyanescens]
MDSSPERITGSSSFGYRPSILLCYTLVFWNANCLFIEVTTLTYLPLIYGFTTYAPTFYFALQSIKAHARGYYFEPESSKTSLRWAIILACIWCLTIATHVYFWWSATMWADMLTGPLYAGCQPTFIMVYIAARCLLHGRRNRPMISLGNDEELAPEETIRNDFPVPTHQGDVPEASQATIFEPYHPSLFLLFVSIALTVSTAVIDSLKNDIYRGNPIAVASVLQACISIVSLQLYIMFRVIRQKDIAEDFSAIADLIFELTIIWLSTRVIIIAPGLVQGKYTWWSALGTVETCLLLYFSVQYALRLSKRSKYIRTINNESIPEDTTGISAISPESLDEEAAETPTIPVFQPPIYLLAACIVISIFCIRLWVLQRFFVLDSPLIVLAYIPTIIIYTYSIFQTKRPSYADGRRYVKAAEWSVGLSVVWTATYAPNVLVWWRMTRAYWRWLPFCGVIYIAVKYIRDVDARASQRRGVSLPPDDSEVDVEPSS